MSQIQDQRRKQIRLLWRTCARRPTNATPDAKSEQEMVISAEEIKRAQEALKAKGYNPGAASAGMHAKTQEALSEIEKKTI